MRRPRERVLALLLAALTMHSAIAPAATALAQEAAPAESALPAETASVPEGALSSESAAAIDRSSVPASDIGADALQQVDPAAAQAVAGAAAASPRGPRTFALPSGPAKTAVTPQAISLPRAEGSVQGMGESFSPVLSSGTGTFSVPIALPAGRAGVQPSLALSYSTSTGNGPLGIGWSLGVPFIARQVDRGLPRYIDHAAWHREEDRFLYNGGQELVPVGTAAAAAVDCAIYQASQPQSGCDASVPTGLAAWQQYRARVEGGFMRFFRSPDSRQWVVQSPDGTRFDFGVLPDGEAPADVAAVRGSAVEADAALDSGEVRTRESGRGEGPGPRIYRWLLTRMSDAHGSTVYYRYRSDQGTSYLDDVHYVSPASCSSAEDGPEDRRKCDAALSLYGRRVRLVYEDRPDDWSSYVSGWRMVTAQRLKQIVVTAALGEPGSRSLVRRYHLAYQPERESFHSLLASVQVEGRPSEPVFLWGYTWGDNTLPIGVRTVSEESLGDAIVGELLPPMRFGYAQPRGSMRAPEGFVGFDTRIHTSSASPPHSVDEARTDLFDVNSDGLPDVVVTDPARYRTSDGQPGVGVFFNGFSGRDAQPGVAGGFSGAVAMPASEVGGLTGGALSGVLSLDNLNLVPMDVDGDGRGDYLHMPRAATYGYFTATRSSDADVSAAVSPARQGWRWTYVPVALPSGEVDPRIDLGRDGGRIKVLDVNHDQLIDVVRTTGTGMQTWLNLGWLPGGDGRFGSATFDGTSWHLSTAPLESCLLQAGTPLDFDDPEVRLADMNGDGLQDIVKLRRGRVLYWPGRGPGLWGDGPASCARGSGDDRYIEMESAPRELDIESSGVYLEDIDEDGATDIVQVGFTTISVWMNRAGVSFTPRAVLSGTPATPAFQDRVRFADVDGSGTTDILWATAGSYRWIDPMGGTQPRVLTSVDNGLGALTTLEYGSSVEDYLTDLAAAESCTDASCDRFTWSRLYDECDARIQALTGQCAYHSGGSPVVSTVVRAVETTDRFDLLGREENVSRTVFAYHDGYYEGIEREFRGFGAADARAIGDETHPTSITRTFFHQGRRPNAIAADRLADNPDEALKGREYLTETFDELGRYLSSSHASYALRTLHPANPDLGLPAVSYVYVRQTDELRYDSSPFTPGGAILTLAGTSRQDAEGEELSTDPLDGVVARGTPYVRLTSAVERVDNVGHVLVQTAYGRLGTDDVLRKQERPMLLEGGEWIWRTHESWLDSGFAPDDAPVAPDTAATGPRLGHTTNTYDAIGDLLVSSTEAELPITYEIGAGLTPDGGVAASAFEPEDQDLVTSTDLSPWGLPEQTCAGSTDPSDTDDCLRHSTLAYDEDYAQFPESETIAVGPSPGDGDGDLTSTATWDRGLDAIDTVTDPNGATSTLLRDGLGRVTGTTAPQAFTLYGYACDDESLRPTVHIRYELTIDPDSQPVSRVVTTTETECSPSGDTGLQSVAYVDGLGRVRATLATGDEEHAWVRSGLGLLTPRGTAERAYQPDFLDVESPDASVALALPATPYVRSRYDAFGREKAAVAEDGTTTWVSYHPLSSDACDPLDNDPSSPHYRTCTTARTDGHGRVVDQIQRNRQPGVAALETYRLFTTYREDGAVTQIRRAQTAGDSTTTAEAGHESIRTFTYDTAGRRIGSTDPDTDSRDAGLDATNRTWRYLFNRVGDLVAIRDPRGCGQNFYYDRGGRLLGERYVHCSEAQAPDTLPVGELPSGAISDAPAASSTPVDVRYFFDEYPAWFGDHSGTSWGYAIHPEVTDLEGGPLGRPTGITDRAQTTALLHDRRGDVIWTGRLLAVIGAPGGAASSLSGDDPATPDGSAEGITLASVVYDGMDDLDGNAQLDGRLYFQRQAYDHAGRLRRVHRNDSVNPVPDAEIQYSRRGLPTRLGPPGVPTVIAAVRYGADGQVEQITYGDGDSEGYGHTLDRGATVQTTQYDIRRRPVRTVVTRDGDETADPGTLPYVTRLVDQQLVWDAASNLIAVVDDRDPTEWPEGFRPQTVQIEHDSLYRVTGADFDYTQDDGRRTPEDGPTDYRDSDAGMGAVQSMDPMHTRPAPMLPDSGAIASRVGRLEWRHDWLANTTRWADDPDGEHESGQQFYERGIGNIGNGADDSGGRPSALRIASNLPPSVTEYNPSTDRGGWLSVDYGEGGNVVAMTVRARCHDTDSSNTCEDPGGETDTRRDAMVAGCICAAEQHYRYRWDELNRLVDAQRYDRAGSDNWTLAARQRYRYDAANQRMVKDVTHVASSEERVALYPFPGDIEVRGLRRDTTAYVGYPTHDDIEIQNIVAGARFVYRHDIDAHDEGGFNPWNRATIPITDLIGTTSGTIDLYSGALTETSTYYPNGATETYRAFIEPETGGDDFAPREPMGFTAKEADEEVGLVYFGERYLIPRIGRWASPDPLAIHAVEGGEALNAYHYVGGSLLQTRDPLGLQDAQVAGAGGSGSRCGAYVSVGDCFTREIETVGRSLLRWIAGALGPNRSEAEEGALATDQTVWRDTQEVVRGATPVATVADAARAGDRWRRGDHSVDNALQMVAGVAAVAGPAIGMAASEARLATTARRLSSGRRGGGSIARGLAALDELLGQSGAPAQAAVAGRQHALARLLDMIRSEFTRLPRSAGTLSAATGVGAGGREMLILGVTGARDLAEVDRSMFRVPGQLIRSLRGLARQIGLDIQVVRGGAVHAEVNIATWASENGVHLVEMAADVGTCSGSGGACFETVTRMHPNVRFVTPVRNQP